MSRLKPVNLQKQRRVKNYQSCRCHQGHIHHSRGEAGWCNNLELRKKAGDIADYETQVSYDFIVNGKKVCGHRPDFRVHGTDGSVWIEEYKGWGSEIWRLKKALFEALYPDIKYVVIKHQNKRR